MSGVATRRVQCSSDDRAAWFGGEVLLRWLTSGFLASQSRDLWTTRSTQRDVNLIDPCLPFLGTVVYGMVGRFVASLCPHFRLPVDLLVPTQIHSTKRPAAMGQRTKNQA